jgi:CBS domain-containing protein
MKVKNVMSKNVLCVNPETTYEESAKLMYENNFSGLPVIDNKGNLVGIISEKDLFRAMYPNYEDFIANPEEYFNHEEQEKRILEIKNNPIKMYMSKKVIFISPETSLMAAGGIMLAHHIHRLPVLENGKLVGIVSREDIYKAILKHYLGF